MTPMPDVPGPDAPDLDAHSRNALARNPHGRMAVEVIDGLLAEVRRLRARVAELESECNGLRAFKQGVDEALNSGDGSYRP